MSQPTTRRNADGIEGIVSSCLAFVRDVSRALVPLATIAEPKRTHAAALAEWPPTAGVVPSRSETLRSALPRQAPNDLGLADAPASHQCRRSESDPRLNA